MGIPVVFALLAIVATQGPGAVEAQAATHCTFVLGFATLHDLIPDSVGSCLDNESHNPENGDGLQHTTNGLLVWRKSDNFTAFTDGYRAWVNGPDGLQERLNTQRFAWEANPQGLPVVGGGSLGIEGDVVLGPTTPVCRVGVPCSRPVAASIDVQDAAGRLVTRFATGADGHFQISLAPGIYTLLPEPLRQGSPLPRPITATVTVTRGAFTQVELTYDTGIR